MTQLQKTFTQLNTPNACDAEAKPANAPKDLTMDLSGMIKRLHLMLTHVKYVQKILLKKLRKKYENRAIPIEEMYLLWLDAQAIVLIEEMYLLWLDAQAIVLPRDQERQERYQQQRKALLAKIARYTPPMVPAAYAASKRLKERYALGGHPNSWAFANEKRKHKIRKECEAILQRGRP